MNVGTSDADDHSLRESTIKTIDIVPVVTDATAPGTVEQGELELRR